MLPRVAVYNSVSIDGAIKDFDIDIALHFERLGDIGAEALLVGSATAKSGAPEEPRDYVKPKAAPKDTRPSG